MLLGIEIGGTKLQFGVGTGDGSRLIALERCDVDIAAGAGGILRAIEEVATDLIKRHDVRRVGVGFGGPVASDAAHVVRSHQVDGWENFPLAGWVRDVLRLPAVVANDADVAALAEAHFGAGRGKNPVLYVTVGTGVGGGLVVNGEIYRGSGTAAVEMGHLRPGLMAESAEHTVESIASGLGIAEAAQARMSGPVSHPLRGLTSGASRLDADAMRQRLIDVEEIIEESAADLLERCNGQPERLTAKMIGEAAIAGNTLAQEVVQHACQVLGWGVAQAITLLAPQVVVVGGGVSLIGEEHFFRPLRQTVHQYVFPPLVGSYQVLPAELSEQVVVHGALKLAAIATGEP